MLPITPPRAPLDGQSCATLAPIVLAAIFGIMAFHGRPAAAGGGPENLFLLVNASSPDSLTVANHYIAQLAAVNVHYLKWDPAKHSTSGAVFRNRILLPTLKEIERRGLEGQIDYLVYSCDFPWQLKFQNDFPKEKFPSQLKPIASLTGATYLSPFVQDQRKEMFNLNTNFYAVTPRAGMTVSRGFRSGYYWAPGGKRSQDPKRGIAYRLSTMLGVTCDRGSTVKEIISYLRRSAGADGTAPQGTIYLMKNKGIRSSVRHSGFADVQRELKQLGVRAEILQGTLPIQKIDVMGITMGAAHYNLIGSKVALRPGAIGDNLTSYGGYFVHREPWKPPKDDPNKKPPGPPQTVLTDFLRLGAAGASGTVIEPYAIAAKFPMPSIHVHYARGCSLAEAFYQSVTGPFQLLVVGDPLCRPWAVIPEVTVEGVSDGQKLSGPITITPTATAPAGTKIAQFELFIDGVRTERCMPAETLSVDTAKLADGIHQLRVVAIDDSPIETQGRWSGQVTVKNGKDALQMALSPPDRVSSARSLKISTTCTLNVAVTIMQNHRVVGTIRGGQGSLNIDAGDLGKGPVTLHAKTAGTPGLLSRPVTIEIY